jgi:hypothetical protein
VKVGSPVTALDAVPASDDAFMTMPDGVGTGAGPTPAAQPSGASHWQRSSRLASGQRRA